MAFFPPIGDNFQNILSIINQSKNVIADLSAAGNTIIAFRRQFPPLMLYIKSHIIEITKIALLEVTVDNKSERDFCFMILCSNVPAFDLSLSTNHQFLIKISDFITKTQNFNFDALASFSFIMHSLITNTNGYILVGIPNREEFIGKLFNLIEYRPIFSLLFFITDEGKQYVTEFLDTDIFATYLFKFIDKFPRRVFQLLLNLVKTSKADSKFMKCVMQADNLSTVYNIAITSNYQFTSTKAFNFLIEACKVFSNCEDEDSDEYEEEEEKKCCCIFEFLIEKIPNLCQFICKDPFIMSHSPACKLLISVIPQTKEIPKDVYDTVKNLFEEIFKYPHHSFLHFSCCKLFSAILEKDQNVFKKIDIREKILWANKTFINDIRCVFWGHLYQLTKMIIDSKTNFDQDCPGWDDYVNTTFQIQDKIISSPYGGVLPKDKRGQDFLSTIIIE